MIWEQIESGETVFTTEVSNDDYHGNKTHISASRLKTALNSIRDLITYESTTGKKAHFEIGNLFELWLTEPFELEEKCVVFNENDRPEKEKTMASKLNKDWKANFYEENDEKIIVTQSEFDHVESMVRETLKDSLIANLVSKSIFQASVFWTDMNGLKVKTRPDLLIEFGDGKVIIIDIKTSIDADIKSFTKSAQKLNYPFQAIMQILGLEAAGFEVSAYYWLVTGKNENYPLTQMFRFANEDQDVLRSVYESTSFRAKTALDQHWKDEQNVRRDSDGIAILPLSDYYINSITNN